MSGKPRNAYERRREARYDPLHAQSTRDTNKVSSVLKAQIGLHTRAAGKTNSPSSREEWKGLPRRALSLDRWTYNLSPKGIWFFIESEILLWATQHGIPRQRISDRKLTWRYVKKFVTFPTLAWFNLVPWYLIRHVWSLGIAISNLLFSINLFVSNFYIFGLCSKFLIDFNSHVKFPMRLLWYPWWSWILGTNPWNFKELPWRPFNSQRIDPKCRWCGSAYCSFLHRGTKAE